MILVFLLVLLEFCAFGMIIPLSPYLAKDFGADDLQVGLLMSVYSLAQLIMAPFWGNLSDHLGRKPVILTCLLGSFLFYLWFALAQDLSTLFLTRILAGAFGGVMPVAMACIADLTEKKNRSKNMGLIGAGIGLGFMIGPFLGGIFSLIGSQLGSAPPFGSSFSAVGGGIICLLNCLVVLFFFKESFWKALKKISPTKKTGSQALSLERGLFKKELSLTKKPDSQDTTSPTALIDQTPENSVSLHSAQLWISFHRWKSILTHFKNTHKTRFHALIRAIKYPVLKQVLCMHFFLTLALAGVEASLFLYVRDKLSWSHFPASFGFAYIGLMMIVTQGVLIRKMIPKWGERKVALLGFLLASFGFAGVGLTHWLWFVTLSVTLLCVGYGLASSCLSGAVSLLTTKDQQGGVLGVHQSVFSLGRILGPALGGWFYRDLSPSAPFYVSGFLALLALAVCVHLKSRFPQKGQQTGK